MKDNFNLEFSFFHYVGNWIFIFILKLGSFKFFFFHFRSVCFLRNLREKGHDSGEFV